MFGFGKVGGLNRRQYDARIEQVLREQMGIETDDTKNPMFPGFLKFAELKSRGWHGKFKAEFNALAIAVSYISGAHDSGKVGVQEAKRIVRSINSTLGEALSHDLITQADATKFQQALDQISERLN